MNMKNIATRVYGDTINIECHPSTWKKIRKDLIASLATCTAFKTCDVRHRFGVYILDGDEDAINAICSAWDV